PAITSLEDGGYVVSWTNHFEGQSTINAQRYDSNDRPYSFSIELKTKEDEEIIIDVLANDSDIDGDKLFITDVDEFVYINGVNVGRVEIIGDNDFKQKLKFIPGDNLDKLIENEEELLSFEYSISDRNGTSDSATVTLKVIGTNDAPIANSESFIINEDESIDIDVLSNDADIDGNKLFIVDVEESVFIDGVKVGETQIIEFNNSQKIRFIPTNEFDKLSEDQRRFIDFEYTISDERGATHTAKVNLDVLGKNDRPTANDDRIVQYEAQGEIQVAEQYPGLEHKGSNVSSLNDGGYVVVWSAGIYSEFGHNLDPKREPDGSLMGIFSQRYDEKGEKFGEKIQVNTYTNDLQIAPSVDTLENGNYVISWTSKGQDGDDFGVYSQIFKINGEKIGEEKQVNTYTTDRQSNSSVSALEDGGYVIVWESYNNGHSI
ncbi:MAG: Ig-like domain-containing protein, partial [Fusobacterium sp.]